MYAYTWYLKYIFYNSEVSQTNEEVKYVSNFYFKYKFVNYI